MDYRRNNNDSGACCDKRKRLGKINLRSSRTIVLGLACGLDNMAAPMTGRVARILAEIGRNIVIEQSVQAPHHRSAFGVEHKCNQNDDMEKRSHNWAEDIPWHGWKTTGIL